MDPSTFVSSIKALASANHTRRAALRGVGLGGLAAGLLGALGAPSSRAQDWRGTTPTPAAGGGGSAAPNPAVSSGGRFPGVTGGLPPFAMNLEASAPTVLPAGTLRWGSKMQLPVLQGMAIAAATVQPHAVRELHWHLNANELNYVLSGQGRMGVFSTDGTGSTFDLQPGSISFVPEGYTHYIQNTGDEELHVILAFTHEQPETTDLSQALPSFPNICWPRPSASRTTSFPSSAPVVMATSCRCPLPRVIPAWRPRSSRPIRPTRHTLIKSR